MDNCWCVKLTYKNPCQSLSVVWKTEDRWDSGRSGRVPWDGEPLACLSNLAPGRAVKRPGICAAKVDKVTMERT